MYNARIENGSRGRQAAVVELDDTNEKARDWEKKPKDDGGFRHKVIVHTIQQFIA